ncbi:17380_t:CDS:2 [Acaulospora morrowiae]|uniref:17380_t:CDS:1 n=1 Tax=Acaulospora morrowiae TaxID=94023 RepID=A0A9N8VWP6_9GLOM|nr:17380_t:CDS:2 [Acaulospora morrowiae]
MPKYKKLFDQDYKVIHMHCARTASHFMDDKFPPTDSSLWKTGVDNHHEPVVWKRVKELTPDPHLFIFDNSKKLNTDIIQGEVGNCWLVSALSVLSAHPHLLQKVVPHWSMQDWNHSDEPGRKLGVYNFRDTERHPGVFRFRFYRFGEWVEVVVDDYLPTRNDRLIYAHSRNPNEMWCSLLEKAYAKLCGCYEALESGSPSDALVDLTGTVPDTIDLNGETMRRMGEKKFLNMLQMSNRSGALMSCSINVLEGEVRRERLPNGLVIGHSYGITDIQIIKVGMFKRNNEILLVRLHNPWGEVEWNGAWSDNSPEWNIIDKAKRNKLGFKIAEDGDFWMSFRDFITNFSTLVICRHLNTSLFSLEKRWCGIAFRGEWSVENETAGGCINNPETFHQNPQYSIRVTKPIDLVIALMQKDHRSEIGVENVTIGFVCFKIEENREYRIHKPTYEIVGRVTYVNAREVSMKISLKCGHYVLIPSTYNVGEEGEFFMRLFSSKSVIVRPLIKDAPEKKWYYPIVYFGKSYFVGMVRIKIIGVNLMRELGKGYVTITFSDLNDRIKQSLVAPKFGDALAPDINAEYVFYVRDPPNAKILFHLHESTVFGSDKMLGETGILVGRYSRHGKEEKIWEITKTFTKIIKVPPQMRTVKDEEREVAGDNVVNANRRTEPLTDARFEASNNQEGEDSEEEQVLRSIPNQKIIVVPVRPKRRKKKRVLVPMAIDAGIGEIQVRITYYQGVKA